MADRTFAWWKVKLGFRGDEEWIRLALAAPDRATYFQAVGLMFCLFDAAHKTDNRKPERGPRMDHDGPIVALLVDAGLLDADGSIPERAWSKYRVPQAQRAKDPVTGRFVQSHDGPRMDHDGATVVPSGPQDRERRERTSVEHETNERLQSATRSRVQPEHVADTAAFKRLRRRTGYREPDS